MEYFGDTEFQSFVPNMDSEPEKYSYFLSKFRKLTTENPYISVIVVNPLNGTPLVVGNNTNTYYGNSQQRELFEKETARLHQIALQNDGKGVWVTSQTYDTNTGRNINTLVFVQALKEIKVASQHIIGTMLIVMSNDEMQNWLQSAGNQEHGDFYLVNKQDGTIVLAQDERRIGNCCSG